MSIALLPRELPRQTVLVSTDDRSTWCLETRLSSLIRCGKKGSGIKVWCTNFTKPPYASSVYATNNAADKNARLTQDHGLRLWMAFERNNTVYRMYSDDDGATWSSPSVLFAASRWPTVVMSEHIGLELWACYRSGNLVGRTRYPGQSSPSDEFTMLKSDGTPISVADDSFHIQPMYNTSGAWILHVKSGGGNPAVLYSYDDGATWGNAVATISGGYRPTIAVSMLNVAICAAYRGGNIYAKRKYGGEAAFGSEFAFVDGAGSPLSVSLGQFHIQPAVDGQQRWILTAWSGASLKDWQSFDDGATWELVDTTT